MALAPKCPRPCRKKYWRGQRTLLRANCIHARQAVLDNEGKEVIAKGQMLNDEQILKMSWLVQGVQGKLP